MHRGIGVCKVVQDGHGSFSGTTTTWPFKVGSGDWVALIEGHNMDPPRAESLKIYKFTDLYISLVKAWRVWRW